MVEDVKEVGTEVQLDPLTSDWEVFLRGEVEVHQTWPVVLVAPLVAILPRADGSKIRRKRTCTRKCLGSGSAYWRQARRKGVVWIFVVLDQLAYADVRLVGELIEAAIVDCTKVDGKR